MRLLAILITVFLLLNAGILSLVASADLRLGHGTGNQQSSGAPAGDDSKSNSGQSPAPKSQPDASGKYHVGAGVTPPTIIHTEEPDFTNGPRYKRISGITMISLVVDTHGDPQEVQVYRSLADSVRKKQRAEAIELDEKAVEAVKKYHFAPATFNGEPVPVEVRVEIHYRIH